MKEQLKKPLIIFLISMVVLAAAFFFLPLNLFDGVVEYEEPTRSYSVNAPLSLSYFIGMGYDPADMENVKTFYLTTKGIILACAFIIGVPALTAYRVHLRKTSK